MGDVVEIAAFWVCLPDGDVEPEPCSSIVGVNARQCSASAPISARRSWRKAYRDSPPPGGRGWNTPPRPLLVEEVARELHKLQ